MRCCPTDTLLALALDEWMGEPSLSSQAPDLPGPVPSQLSVLPVPCLLPSIVPFPPYHPTLVHGSPLNPNENPMHHIQELVACQAP